jgi:hypothetical protein
MATKKQTVFVVGGRAKRPRRRERVERHPVHPLFTRLGTTWPEFKRNATAETLEGTGPLLVIFLSCLEDWTPEELEHLPSAIEELGFRRAVLLRVQGMVEALWDAYA